MTIRLDIDTFELGTGKEAALKPLEESAEVFGAWQDICDLTADDEDRTWAVLLRQRFADEIADCIQACVNLATRYGVDLNDAMGRCWERNKERGRC